MVIRGGAIEKAAIIHMVRQGVTMPDITGDVDTFVFQMEVFPENPYCPMGHFNTEGITREPRFYNMNLDLFPAVRVEEDLRAMKAAMDVVADRFGKDREKMREGLDTLYTMEHFAAPIAAKVGCKQLKLIDEDRDFVFNAYETFLDVYPDIISKRKGMAYTESDVQLKLERNGKWLQFLLLKEGAIKSVHELVPPEMLVEMGFPPSAIF
jgi:coproporphyrinogen III oxidase